MAFPYYNNYYPQNQQLQNAQQFLPQAQPQIQSPFVMVRSEAEARNYPVGFGNVVSFKDENSPYIYTKTMGFSQSDKPVFEKYRKEDTEEPKDEKNSKFDEIEAQIKDMQKEINFLKEKRKNEHNGNGKSV